MSTARELIRDVRRQAAAHEPPSPAMVVALADALERALDANVALRARVDHVSKRALAAESLMSPKGKGQR